MLVKELIEKLKELPEDLPVYYIDDGAYVDFNAALVEELTTGAYSIIMPYRYCKDDSSKEVFKAVVLDTDFRKMY